MDDNGKGGGVGGGAGASAGGVRELNLGSLGNLRGGVVAEQFNEHLERVLKDCRDRPTNVKARTITLQLEVTPVASEITRENPDLTKVDMVVQMKSTIPTHAIDAHQARLRRVKRAGQETLMAVVGGDPDDADQMTFNQ